MQNPVFILKSGLITGSYLLGNYVWTEAMRIDSASLIGVPPGVGSVTLSLEVNGVVTEKQFVIAVSDLAEVRATLNLGIKLAAGQSLRWLVTAFDGDVESAADHVEGKSVSEALAGRHVCACIVGFEQALAQQDGVTLGQHRGTDCQRPVVRMGRQ